jgi:tRNA(Ile)-lysidine synthetase, N-terminal domain
MSIQKNRRQDIKKLFASDAQIYAAVSGGADSIALLHMLHCAGIKPVAVHVNHMLRGAESDRDEQFVKDFCDNLGLEYITKSINIETLAKDRGEGIEAAARFARYSFFANLGGEVAVAHTLSDSAETVLMHITRGCSVAGLTGIAQRAEIHGAKVVRPLLDWTREEIEKYCLYNNLEYITDSSNLSADYTRNKIRLEVVPVLKEINPNFERAVENLIRSATEDEDYFDSYTQGEVASRMWIDRLDVSGAAHPARLLAAYLAKCGAVVNREVIDGILDGDSVNISMNDSTRHRLVKKDGYVWIE